EIVAYLEGYAELTQAPVRCGVGVTSLRIGEDGTGLLAQTSSGPIAASNVVIATGPYQRPVVAPIRVGDCNLFQVHAKAYKAPEQLPCGAVLIVGSGAWGAQIAEELLRAGRKVYLSIGRHKRMPRRYRGHDLIWWLGEMGLDRTPVEKRGPDATLPLITGAYGGHTIDFRAFAKLGITLLVWLISGKGNVLDFADDLGLCIASGDAAYCAFLDLVDAYVERHKIGLPPEPAARVRLADPPSMSTPLRRLDIEQARLGSLIWAT